MCNGDACLAHFKSIIPIIGLMAFSAICILHSENPNLYYLGVSQVPVLSLLLITSTLISLLTRRHTLILGWNFVFVFYFCVSSNTILVFNSKLQGNGYIQGQSICKFYVQSYRFIFSGTDPLPDIMTIFSFANFQPSNELNFNLQFSFQIQSIFKNNK